MERFRRLLFGHPVKSFINVFFGLVGNVFAGAYILDITRASTNTLQFPEWKSTPYSPSFWGAVAVFVLFGLYSWRSTVHESDVQSELEGLRSDNAMTTEAIQALMPVMIEAVERQIRAGEVKTVQEVFEILRITRDRHS